VLPAFGSITALHDHYRRESLRPSDVVEAWLAFPAALREAPVWISTVDAVTLRSRVALLDAELAADPIAALRKPLFGTLYAAKDNIDVAGLATTAACPAFAYRPTSSAAVIELLDAAGAIPAGKTNLDQFATGLVGTRSPYGAVPNARLPDYISGGSSSGSAVAVAQGLVHFALGTDTAGSGRVPAGLNNIVGWKPSRGLLSTRGVVPACRSLDCVSILAATVPDAARVFAVAAQFDPRDEGSRRLPLSVADPRSPFRFAVPRPEDLDFFGDAEAAAAFDAAVERLQALGGVPVPIDFAPWSAVADLLYEGPWVAERHAAIRSFFDAHPGALDPTVASIIRQADRYSATDAFAAAAGLDGMRAELQPLWAGFDVLVVPTTPTAYTIDAVTAAPVELNRRLGRYTNFVNLLDLAAMAVPASIQRNGLPFGITLIAPAGHDCVLAELGQRFHQAGRLPLGAGNVRLPPAEKLLARAEVTRIAVVGAHMNGLPLNHELTDRNARLIAVTRTAPLYRFYRLPDTVPAKPGLVRVGDEGASIELEVWELATRELGSFVAAIPSPLCLGSIELINGAMVQGFVCEAFATEGAEDISVHGGWRRYLESSRSSGALVVGTGVSGSSAAPV
jgi:allophanate hydrolase